MKALLMCLLVLVAVGLPSTTATGEPFTLETVEPPPEISPGEPLAREFSLERAARALDGAALHWQKTHACTACHTDQRTKCAVLDFRRHVEVWRLPSTPVVRGLRPHGVTLTRWSSLTKRGSERNGSKAGSTLISLSHCE